MRSFYSRRITRFDPLQAANHSWNVKTMMSLKWEDEAEPERHTEKHLGASLTGLFGWRTAEEEKDEALIWMLWLLSLCQLWSPQTLSEKPKLKAEKLLYLWEESTVPEGITLSAKQTQSQTQPLFIYKLIDCLEEFLSSLPQYDGAVVHVQGH